jgi:bifunctional DNA-binding transcriptional regulator/antitoxin component of YhaV-PrlF toxin-antitoxin module
MQRMHVSKIDTSRRISISKKVLKLLECEPGDYITINQDDHDKKKICLEKFKG